jgi:magnesium-transporting ATPase (P-type)
MLAMQVGSNSEWGKTLEQLQEGEVEETPLQKKLAQLAGQIGTQSSSLTIDFHSILIHSFTHSLILSFSHSLFFQFEFETGSNF